MKLRFRAVTWYILLLSATVILALVLPPSEQTLRMLHISALAYHEAIVTLILPYAIIWFSAFYAYDKLHQYTHAISGTAEGDAFKSIAYGVTVLAWGLAIPTLLSLLLGVIEIWQPNFHAAHTLISAYVTLAVTLVAFTLINSGTHKLVNIVKARPRPNTLRIVVFIFIVSGLLFARIVLRSRTAGSYPLSYYPLVLTIIAPYLYTWIVGLYSTYELYLYARKVKGIFYQQALNLLANGLIIVIVSSILTQYVSASLGARASISLATVLLALYALLIVQGAGFALVALGSKRLKRIEEV